MVSSGCLQCSGVQLHVKDIPGSQGQFPGRPPGLDPSLADVAPVSVEQPSHVSSFSQQSGDLCQCCHQGHPETLLMSPYDLTKGGWL